MKIALYMTTVLEHGGGLEKYLIETAAHLSREPGVTVDVITMDDDFTGHIVSALQFFYFKKIDKKFSFKESADDIRARLGHAHYYKLHTIGELREKLREYDVVYSKNELLEGFIFTFLVGYKRIPPVIFGGHTPLFYPQAHSFHAKLHNFLYAGLIYKLLASGVTKFHALNNNEEATYRRLFGEDKVVKIYNPFDAGEFRRLAQQYPYCLPPSNAVKVLWLGRLTAQKGVEDLVAVINAVQNQEPAPNITWTIAGDGELRPFVEAVAHSYPNVQYLGHVDQKHVASLYAAHDIFLSTSQWEGYPYSLLEAQSFGLTILAYDIPGASDILASYRHGYLAEDLGDLVAHLRERLDDPAIKNAAHEESVPIHSKPEFAYARLLQLFKLEPTQ